MAKVVGDTIVPGIPLRYYEAWVARGVDWLAMSEDLPHPDNRVMVDAEGRVRLHYTPNNLTAHGKLVSEARRLLRRLGFWKVMVHSHKARNTTHQCGTLVFGTDPTAIGARPVLPRARRAQPVRRGRVVLPFVSRGEPGPDHHRAGFARRRSHRGD